MQQDRKTVIADAAIALLASAGAKGLTHRAVDAQAGLPAGSTSFYCRTRMELLTLALLRHASLDLSDLEDDAHQWARGEASPERFVDALSRRVTDWLSPAKHARLVARFELFMIASREPELAAIVDEQRVRFLKAAVEALRRVGVARPESVAPGLVATVDGMLLDQIVAANRALTSTQRKALLRKVIQAVDG